MSAADELRKFAAGHRATVTRLPVTPAPDPHRTRVERRIAQQVAAAADSLATGRVPSPEGCALLAFVVGAQASAGDDPDLVQLAKLLERAALIRVPLSLRQRSDLIALDATDTDPVVAHRDAIRRLISDELLHGYEAFRFAVDFADHSPKLADIVRVVDHTLAGEVQDADTAPLRVVKLRS